MTENHDALNLAQGQSIQEKIRIGAWQQCGPELVERLWHEEKVQSVPNQPPSDNNDDQLSLMAETGNASGKKHVRRLEHLYEVADDLHGHCLCDPIRWNSMPQPQCRPMPRPNKQAK